MTTRARSAPAVLTAALALLALAPSALAQGGTTGGTGLSTVWYVVLAVLALFVLIGFIFLLQFINLYVQALTSNATVGIFEMIGMKLRKVDMRTIILNRIAAVKAGLEIPTSALEQHYLAGGRVTNTVRAIIAARAARIELPWNIATAIDLAGRDILDAVQTSVNPKVIDCPAVNGPRATIDAVAKNGIQLKCKARVTVRTNIARLVGGATEETVIARVGQGIVSTIGSADDHKHVLENPDQISKKVMESGLDAGTAFEILSIDIADIDVGDNIGAKLNLDQANAQKQMAQAEAEQRRAMAMAVEQENRAKIEENKAKLVLAEAEVPQAIADAFRSGRLGVMDYYRLKNMQADTSMRESIAGDGGPTKRS
jgi:uncharacterized protein YqfA (UPF0365 family)